MLIATLEVFVLWLVVVLAWLGPYAANDSPYGTYLI